MCPSVCVCVSNYLVVCPDLSGEDRKVVKTKRHIIAHILVQPLIIWAGVPMETHIDIFWDYTLSRHTRPAESCNRFGEGCLLTKYTFST